MAAGSRTTIRSIANTMKARLRNVADTIGRRFVSGGLERSMEACS
jgi:hypothetical protein